MAANQSISQSTDLQGGDDRLKEQGGALRVQLERADDEVEEVRRVSRRRRAGEAEGRMVWLTSCCCGFSVKSGTKAVAIFSLVSMLFHFTSGEKLRCREQSLQI